MKKNLKILKTENTYPYSNLAMEEYLTTHTVPGEVVLFLWQNRRTVVIGKNQNCWKECNVRQLEEDGGYLVRRLSGGGAVYHDMGNLNFTFCATDEDYDLEKQLEVVLCATKALGINAEKTGRNDLTVEGRKFSGNAFYKTGKHRYHHGTIMLDVEKDALERYLNVDPKKLTGKGVDSVRSRVASLKEFCPGITTDIMAEAMIQSFQTIYGSEALRLPEEDHYASHLQPLTEKFESWEWKYGRNIPFDHHIEDRFPWGGVELQLHVEKGVIADLNLFSDAMDQDLIEIIRRSLMGVKYHPDSMSDAVNLALPPYDRGPMRIQIIEDITKMLSSCCV